jgi:hypothetical protein
VNPADFDDGIDRCVDAMLRAYEREREPQDKITRTQLAAVSAVAEGGWEKLAGIVRMRIATGDRNDRAAVDGKGFVRAKNPAFWSALQETLEGDMKRFGDDRERRDLAASLFAARLAIEVQYRLETAGGAR